MCSEKLAKNNQTRAQARSLSSAARNDLILFDPIEGFYYVVRIVLISDLLRDSYSRKHSAGKLLGKKRLVFGKVLCIPIF